MACLARHVTPVPDAYGQATAADPLASSGNADRAEMAGWLLKWHAEQKCAGWQRGSRSQDGVRLPHGYLHKVIFLQLSIQGRYANLQLAGRGLAVALVSTQRLNYGLTFHLRHGGADG